MDSAAKESNHSSCNQRWELSHRPSIQISKHSKHLDALVSDGHL
jgi:hypothetical protein